MASWVTTTGSEIPKGAIRAGYEDNGNPLFIARAEVEGILTSGKCGFHLKGAHIPSRGKEVIVNLYEVLVLPISALGFYGWLRESNGKVPNKALQTAAGYYVGRALYSGNLIPCKIAIYPPYMCAYMGYGGKEHSTKEYEVLYQIK